MFNQRTIGAHQKLKDLVASGDLGEIQRTNYIITTWFRSQSYYDSGGWRATWEGEGGGVLMNQCPHNLDLWQWICGMPTRCRAFVGFGKYHDIEVDDEVTAYVEYENGATGVFITTTGEAPWHQPSRNHWRSRQSRHGRWKHHLLAHTRIRQQILQRIQRRLWQPRILEMRHPHGQQRRSPSRHHAKLG